MKIDSTILPTQKTIDDLPKMSWMIVGLGLLAALGPFSIDMYLPAFSDIGKGLNSDIAMVQYSLVSFFIGLAGGQLFWGPISDRFGRKLPMQLGIIIYIISSIICALVQNIEMLIICRLLQAFGTAAPMVLTRAIIRDRFNKNYAAKVFSLLILIMSIAPILAPIFGGYLVLIFSWRAIFWFLVVYSLLCLIITRWFPETHKIEARNAQITFKSAFFTYIKIIKDRSFIGYALTGSFVYAFMFSYIAGSPFVIIDFYGVSKEHFGWFFGINAFSLIITAQLNSRLLSKYSYQYILQNGCIAIVSCSLILLMAFLLNASLWQVVPIFFINLGLIGFITPNSVAGALSEQGSRAGSASALFGTIQFICSAFASSMIGFFHNQTPIPMAVIIVLCVLFSLLTYIILVKSNLKKL